MYQRKTPDQIPTDNHFSPFLRGAKPAVKKAFATLLPRNKALFGVNAKYAVVKTETNTPE